MSLLLALSYFALVSAHPLANISTGLQGGASFGSKVAAAWYPGWHGTDFPPEKVSWKKYTSVSYAFAFVEIPQMLQVLPTTDHQLNTEPQHPMCPS